jgi:hypothetical protein
MRRPRGVSIGAHSNRPGFTAPDATTGRGPDPTAWSRVEFAENSLPMRMGRPALVRRDWIEAHLDQILADAADHRRYLQSVFEGFRLTQKNIKQSLESAQWLPPGWCEPVGK